MALEIIRGTLDLLVLQTLTAGAKHGLEILGAIETATGQRIRVEQGALYPALQRMERRRWLRGEWRRTREGRRARYYSLTASGRRSLDTVAERWTEYVNCVEAVLRRRYQG